MTDRADLLAAARDLRDGLGLLGFPLIGEAVFWDVEHMAKAPLARGAEARRLLAEGERLATRLQGATDLVAFDASVRADQRKRDVEALDGSGDMYLEQAGCWLEARALDGKDGE